MTSRKPPTVEGAKPTFTMPGDVTPLWAIDATAATPDEKAMPTNVIAAVARVALEIGGIEKLTPTQRAQRGMGSTGGERGITYAYRGIDVIASEAQPLFGKYGVVIVPIVASYEQQEIKTSGGGTMTAYLATVDWRVYGPGGLDDQFTATTVGEARDSGDKAMNKAHTAAFKNLLLRILCIGDPQDDTDNFHTSDEGATSSGQTSRPAAAAFAGSTPCTLDEWAEAWSKALPKHKNPVIKYGSQVLGVKNINEPGELMPAMMWALRNVEAGREAGQGPVVAAAEPDPVEPETVEPDPVEPETAQQIGAATPHTCDYTDKRSTCTICGAEQPF